MASRLRTKSAEQELPPEDVEWGDEESPPEDTQWGDEEPATRGLPFQGAAARAEASTEAGDAPTPLPLTGKNVSGAILTALTGGVVPAPPGLRKRPVGLSEKQELGPQTMVAQGVLRNFGDEAAGAMAQTSADLRTVLGEAPPDPTRQAYRLTRDEFRDTADAYQQESPVGALLLQALGGAATSPFGGTTAAIAEGALSGVGASKELDQNTVRDAAVGGLLGYAGKQAGDVTGELGGRLLNNVSQRAGQRVAAAELKAEEMAAKKVAEDIASAKGKLGATTQEANRAVENLLRLEGTGGLSGEQQGLLAALRQNGTLPALQQKLADAMLEQVPGAAGRVDTARDALAGLVDRQNEAVDAAAQALLSGGEAKRQVAERVKRYLPTVVGSMYGAAPGAGVGLALGGDAPSTLIGALAGAGLRPALHAGRRMAAHPAVQRAVFSPIQSAAQDGERLASSELLQALLEAAARSEPTQQSLIDALRPRKDQP